MTKIPGDAVGDQLEIDAMLERIKVEHEAQSGRDRLWGWFGLSYASFLVLPRVLMHDMPDDWQKRMAVLLEEYDEAHPNHPPFDTNVQLRQGNKFAKWPAWLLNYRRPDGDQIAAAKRVTP